MRRFDPAVDRLERAPGRLREELNGVVADALRAAGGLELAGDEFEDLDITHEIGAKQALERLAARGDRAAVEFVLNLAAESLDDVGLEALAKQVRQLVDADLAAGVGDRWAGTDPMDRPLLVLRLLVRRQINPEVPAAIHRPWSN